MMGAEDQKDPAVLETRINSLRSEVFDRIDTLDTTVRHRLDADAFIARNGGAIAGAAAIAGLVFGWKAPKGLLISLAVGAAAIGVNELMDRQRARRMHPLNPSVVDQHDLL